MSKTNPAALTLRDAAGLLQQLSFLTEGGLKPAEAIAVLREDAEPRRLTDDRIADGLAQIAAALESDASLATALEQQRVFGVEARAVIQAGDQRDALPAALALLAADFERRALLTKNMLGTIIWPVTLLVILFLVSMLLMVLVIPAFKEVYRSFGAELPGLTTVLIVMSDIFVAWWFILLPLLVALPILLIRLRRRPGTGEKIDQAFLAIPGVQRFLVKVLVGRAGALLAGAITSGIAPSVVIAYLRSTLSNHHLRNAVAGLEQDLIAGMPLATAWRKQPLLPRGLAQLVEIGERSGKLGPALDRAALFYSMEAAHAVAVLGHALQVAVYVFAGLVIGITVIAMYLPIFRLGAVI